MRANTLQVTYLTLQDYADVASNYAFSSGANGKQVPLTSNSTTKSPNGLNIVVDLCENDFNRIKMVPTMALSQATTFLTYSLFASDNFIKDMIVPANIVTQVVDGNGLLADGFVADKSNPSLRGFTMDMDSGELVMTFSEVRRRVTRDIVVSNVAAPNSASMF